MAKLENMQDSHVKLIVEVSSDQFEHGLDYAYDKIKDEVEIKGFRKGKVSRAMYEKHRGVESLYDEALNHVIGETYFDAIEEHALDVVAQPKIDLDITTVEKGKGFTYSAVVAVRPDVTLGEYKGLVYEAPSDDVTDEEVNAEIDRLREQNAELKVLEDATLKDGQTAIFDFEGFVDDVAFEGGKADNYELVIGSGQFIPGFEEQMVGLKTGEEKDIKVTFPENYQAENLKGKDAIFKIKLHEIKEKVLPELTDEFVKELDKEGIETVDALKASTRKTLEENKIKTNKNKKIDFAVEEASKNASISIPEEMITNEKNRMMDNTRQQVKQYGLELEQYLQFSGLTMEQFEANMHRDAEKSIRYNLTLAAIAKAENITASDEEMEEKYQSMATQYNLELEQVKSQINADSIKQEVALNKAVDFIVENLTIK